MLATRENRQADPRAYYRAQQAAGRAVLKAIQAGELVRPAVCSRCGGGKRIEAHHPDYSKPLEVMWLCRRCHYHEHGHAQEHSEHLRALALKRLADARAAAAARVRLMEATAEGVA